jgi:hypothetical protein
MITRHRRGEGVGFVVREASDKPEAPERAEAPDTRREAIAQRESAASAGWEAERAAVIPSVGPDEDKDTQRVAEVVPLYPKPAGGGAAPAGPDRSLGRGVHARADNLVDALRSADIAEAEEIFADMTGLGQVEVLRLLYGPEGRDLALVCRAMGLEQLGPWAWNSYSSSRCTSLPESWGLERRRSMRASWPVSSPISMLSTNRRSKRLWRVGVASVGMMRANLTVRRSWGV